MFENGPQAFFHICGMSPKQPLTMSDNCIWEEHLWKLFYHKTRPILSLTGHQSPWRGAFWIHKSLQLADRSLWFSFEQLLFCTGVSWMASGFRQNLELDSLYPNSSEAPLTTLIVTKSNFIFFLFCWTLRKYLEECRKANHLCGTFSTMVVNGADRAG